MKKVLCFLLILMCMVLSVTSFAENYALNGSLEAKKTLLEGLEAQGDEVEEILSNTSVSVSLGANSAQMHLNYQGTEDVLRFQVKDGQTFVQANDSAFIKTNFDFVKNFYQFSNLHHVTTDYKEQIKGMFESVTQEAPLRKNVYNSLFRTSKFIQIENDKIYDFLSQPYIYAVLPMTEIDGKVWLQNAKEQKGYAEVTFYQADSAVLCVIDLEIQNMPAVHITYLQDQAGVTITVLSDTQEVTDWDEVMVQIERGETQTAKRHDAFVLYFDDAPVFETYLEASVLSADKNVAYEISYVTDDDNKGVALLEGTIKKNNKKMLEWTLDVKNAENQMAEFTMDNVTEDVETVVGQLSEQMQKVVRAILSI